MLLRLVQPLMVLIRATLSKYLNNSYVIFVREFNIERVNNTLWNRNPEKPMIHQCPNNYSKRITKHRVNSRTNLLTGAKVPREQVVKEMDRTIHNNRATGDAYAVVIVKIPKQRSIPENISIHKQYIHIEIVIYK